MARFVITGTLRNGKRFKPIHTDTPRNYNIWKGTLWEIINGKRKRVLEYFN